MITRENITRHEMIGLRTEVVESSNPHIVGLGGTIIDETKSMFILDTTKGFKMIPKRHNMWKFFLNEQKVTISGFLLAKRSYDRVGIKT